MIFTKCEEPAGRVVIPISIRKEFNIKPGDEVKIYLDGENIVIEKFPLCVFCGSSTSLNSHMGKMICKSCYLAIKNSRKKSILF